MPVLRLWPRSLWPRGGIVMALTGGIVLKLRTGRGVGEVFEGAEAGQQFRLNVTEFDECGQESLTFPERPRRVPFFGEAPFSAFAQFGINVSPEHR